MTYGTRIRPATGDVANEIEIEPVVERRVNCVPRTNQEKSIPIRWRAHDGFGGDVATGTRAVLDNKGLTEPLR
jgi:hypothetical protein